MNRSRIHEQAARETVEAAMGRRRFLALMGLGGLGSAAFLSGCANDGAMALPGPIWPDLDESCTLPPAPPTVAQGSATTPLPASGVIARSEWTHAQPVCSLMKPMLPVRHITIHHDGLSPFVATDMRSSAQRIEMIRNGHRGNGWGDIGYHFVIDREGRVWEGRAINFQGAHVKNWNEGNLGICCLGNFDEQAPSPAQLMALERQILILMKTYGVPKNRVKTHQEWAGARTACPGRALQAQMVQMRRGSRLA